MKHLIGTLFDIRNLLHQFDVPANKFALGNINFTLKFIAYFINTIFNQLNSLIHHYFYCRLDASYDLGLNLLIKLSQQVL